MRNHLMPNSGTDAAISYAVEILIRMQATLDTVFHDHPKDLADPSRKPYLRQQFKDVGNAIAELQRMRSVG